MERPCDISVNFRYLLPLDHEPLVNHLVHMAVATEPLAEPTPPANRFQKVGHPDPDFCPEPVTVSSRRNGFHPAGSVLLPPEGIHIRRLLVLEAINTVDWWGIGYDR